MNDELKRVVAGMQATHYFGDGMCLACGRKISRLQPQRCKYCTPCLSNIGGKKLSEKLKYALMMRGITSVRAREILNGGGA